MKRNSKIFAVLLALVLVLTACGGNKDKEAGDVVLKRGYHEAGDTRAFYRVGLVMDKDIIADVVFDAFTYGDVNSGLTFVPMAIPEGAEVHLYSKLVNDEAYSKTMKEKAKATKNYGESLQAILDYVKGKTVKDIEDLLAKSEAGKPIDAISSSTLSSGYSYLRAIADVAKDPMETKAVEVESGKPVSLTAAIYGAHGEKSFADTLTVVSEGKIVAASIDEFQYMGKDAKAVPNAAQEDFNKGFPQDMVLASKKQNSDSYSKKMAEKGKSTVSYAENLKAIETFVVGKSVEELTTFVQGKEKGKPVDEVSGATLVDTVGYLESIIEAGKLAK